MAARWVFNLASQRLTGPDARLDWLAAAAAQTVLIATACEVDRVALPQIGAGIGGLHWPDVKDALAAAESPDVQFEVWTYQG